MNKNLRLLILLTLLTFLVTGIINVTAQQNTFRRTYAFSMMDIPGSMIRTSDGGYLFCGFNSNYIPIYGNITKTNQHGNLIWSKGYLAAIATAFYDVIELSSALGGGYVAVGEANPGAIVVRIDASGNLQWARRYQFPSSEGEFFHKVIQTSDNNLLACGGVARFWDGSQRHDSLMPMAIKINPANGNIIWDRVFVISVPNPDEHSFMSVAESSDGYIFVGYSSEGSGTMSDGDYPTDGLIIKTDASGNLVYARRFGASNESQGLNSILRLSTGDMLVAGYRSDNGILLRFQGAGTPASFNFGHRYSKTYFLIGPEPITFSDVMQTTDGHYAIIGTYIRPFVVPFEIYATITKINSSNGNVMWGRTFAPTGTSIQTNFAILPEGGIAADGSFHMFMTAMNVTGYNYHILKTNQNGQMDNPACPEGSYTPDRNSYTPSLTSFTPQVFSNLATGTSFTPVVNNLNPTVTTVCDYFPCIPPPAPTVTANPTAVCPGGTVTLTASGSGSNVTYHYYTTPSGGTPFASGPTTTVNPTTTTTYYVAAEDNDNPGCMSDRTPVNVNVHPLPNPNVTSNSPVCEGSTLTISAQNGVSYQWSGPNGYQSSNQTINISPATPANSGTYSVTVTDGNNCTNSAQITVTVNPNPSPQITSNPPFLCEGGTVTLDAGSGYASYQWSTTENTQTIVINTPGTYSVTVVDGNNCSGFAQITIPLTPAADATITVTDTVFCTADSPTQFTSLQGGGVWSGPGISPTGMFSPSAAGHGFFTIYYTITDQCGDDQDSIKISVYQSPSITVAYADESCIEGQDGWISLNITGGNPPINIIWSNQATGDSIGNLVPGTYSYTVTDAKGCGSAGQVQIKPGTEDCAPLHVFVPNIFSPNGDGVNDILYVYGYGIKELEMKIYNRWGELLFETTDKSKGWDGTYKNMPCPPGVYVYLLTVKFRNSTEDKVYSGTITLVR